MVVHAHSVTDSMRTLPYGKEGGRERGRERGREEGREGGREGRREEGREGESSMEGYKLQKEMFMHRSVLYNI